MANGNKGKFNEVKPVRSTQQNTAGNACKTAVPALNLQTGGLGQPVSPTHEQQRLPNFGESIMSGGDQNHNEFFSAGGTNDDLKKLLLSARDEDRQALQISHANDEIINFTERGGKGNELRLT